MAELDDIERQIAEAQKQFRRGEDARILLQHPLLKEAFEAADKQLRQEMLQVRARDVEMHSELIRRLQTLETIRAYVTDTITTGEMALERLRVLRKQRSWLTRAFEGVSRL